MSEPAYGGRTLFRLAGALERARAGRIKLANTLGTEPVAEGVEEAGQAEVLASWGCTNGQGWLWAPALPPAEAATFLAPQVTAPAG